MPEIPEEIIKEIMVFLPVKSLLKFRCVSPSWLSYIDSPYFIKTHMLKSTKIIILNASDCVYALDIVNSVKLRAEASVLKLSYKHANTFIFGSCNGILLTNHNNTNFTVPYSVPYRYTWDVVVQNPSTRTFQKIPFVEYNWPGPKHLDCEVENIVFGLGYDALTDDYKVFRNCQYFGCYGRPFYSQVNVYSLRKKSFRQIRPCPFHIEDGMSESVFVGGALHWVVSSGLLDKSLQIGSFDVATEEYRLVEQPVYGSGKFNLYVYVVGGCLSVVCSYERSENKEVWVMKEYGNVESWCKILFIRPVDIGVTSFNHLKPLFYSECGKQILILKDCRKLFWYDLEKRSAEFVELCNHRVPEQFRAFVHMESLVNFSSSGPGPRDEKRGVEHNDKKPNKMHKKRDNFLSKGFKLKL